MAQTILSFRGFVIRAIPFAEADLLVTIFSEDGEKHVVHARQGRKSRKRFGSTLDLFDFGRFEALATKAPTANLQSFIPESGYGTIRNSLSKITCASLLAEVVDLIVPEAHGDSSHEPLFAAFSGGISALVNAPSPKEELRNTYLALASLLAHAGYLDRNNEAPPSLHALRSMMLHVERIVERRLRTKEAVELVAQQL